MLRDGFGLLQCIIEKTHIGDSLFDEFKKITKVVKKIDSNAPHETFLILDATTGQSAINQVEEFKKITPITGIIMTKLDGTAKVEFYWQLAKNLNYQL